MLYHFFEIIIKLCHETWNIQIRIRSIRERKVVSFSENFDSMREIALPTYTLLESSTCSSPTIDFTVEETQNNQLCRQSVYVWLHDLRWVGSSETPNNVASWVTYVCTNRMVTLIDIIQESLIQNFYIWVKTLWKKKTTPTKLSQSQAASMPRRICLRFRE